ncbi:hypothetical protein K2173_014964 [Erythroxylum novogranatense]|uniref:Uncharacterized protein n=1 Tax=Erythroxylum novogranatense TaxID=1862640 RepID=A0AAV8TU91_9ROSI|nr:hypothetical protein K2173_014964 [Erythroxylum novogranatense]
MARKRSSKQKPQNQRIRSHSSLTLRQESSGKVQPNVVARNAKSFLKLDHLQKLAVWASEEASIPPLSVFFGRQFAATAESMGDPPDPSLFSCQKCETILQPGFNCTVRIKKTRLKERSKSNRPITLAKNSVVYECHFCSHQNRKRGTSKCYMKDICPSKIKVKPTKPIPQKCTEDTGVQDEIAMKEDTTLPAIPGDCSIANSPVTPLVKSGTALLDAKKRNRKRSVSKKPEESDTNSVMTASEGAASGSRKRKRKPGMSLKEMAASSERESKQKLVDLTIPFIL